MAVRKTPFFKLRYPFTSDVVSPADVDALAADIDQALVQTAYLGAQFSRFSSVVVQRAAAQSITKSTLTAITFDTVQSDNGTNSVNANAPWWAAANPTRLTAPAPCVVLASAFLGMNFTSAMGTTSSLQLTVALNGAGAGAPGVQGTKWGPSGTATGQTWTSALTMWKLNTGDFLELKTGWTGTPAGPFNTDTVIKPTLALMMVAVPAIP